MKTGLLMSVARVAVSVAVGRMAVGGIVVGVMAVGAADVRAACTTTPNCESMGYKYCASECPSGSVACPFDSSKRFCFSPKPYSVAASTCSSQCKNAGSQSCTRGGVTYYNACGSSKCKSGEECKNGSCVSTCTYTVTKASCDSQCKNVGPASCVRNGTTYYSGCGSSKCSSGQTCNNGTCVTPVPKSGRCCGYAPECGYSGTSHSDDSWCQSNYGMSCYEECKSNDGLPDCSDIKASCRASGGIPSWDGCGSRPSYSCR